MNRQPFRRFRTFRLWHLAAIVAGSALAMAAEQSSPGFLLSIGMTVAIFGPALLVAFVWDGLIGRLRNACRFPGGSVLFALMPKFLVLILGTSWIFWIFQVFRLANQI